jgi:ADP-L-glycero-D-manno-heptose 6-epimerase
MDALFVALGKEPNIEYIPMPSDLQGKYQCFTEATMAKLFRAACPVGRCRWGRR